MFIYKKQIQCTAAVNSSTQRSPWRTVCTGGRRRAPIELNGATWQHAGRLLSFLRTKPLLPSPRTSAEHIPVASFDNTVSTTHIAYSYFSIRAMLQSGCCSCRPAMAVPSRGVALRRGSATTRRRLTSASAAREVVKAAHKPGSSRKEPARSKGTLPKPVTPRWTLSQAATFLSAQQSNKLPRCHAIVRPSRQLQHSDRPEVTHPL
jgi:hypothetical protein